MIQITYAKRGELSLINNGISVRTMKFPGGEVHVTVDPAVHPDVDVIKITASITDSDTLMALLLTTDAVKHLYPHADVELMLPYIPYARQDRVCNFGEALSIKVFASIINAQHYKSVLVVDAHSSVATALIDRCREFTVEDIFSLRRNRGELFPFDTLISPDAGADKKILRCSKLLGKPVVSAEKRRDTQTGEISETVVHTDSLEGQSCLIVDDICDGGRTFIELAKVLKAKGASRIGLYVTHGIFSKGLDVFDGLIDEIYTTDTLPNVTIKRLSVIPIIDTLIYI